MNFYAMQSRREMPADVFAAKDLVHHWETKGIPGDWDEFCQRSQQVREREE